MSQKSVLIITPYFAPQTHAAVFRAHKLAKYLPDYGWKPYVLTVDTNYLYNEDPGLLAELPDEVEIIRTRYIEPTVRGLRMALGGRERTFRTEKAYRIQEGARKKPRSSTWSLRRTAGRLYTNALRSLVFSPDAYWSWYRPALRAGHELVRRHGIDIVYSTAVPFTDHRIAAELQKLGPKWVADFRDPATYGAKNSGSSAWVRERQRTIMRETLQRADAVTGLASTYGSIFTDIYGSISKRPYLFIPTGIDDSLIPTDESLAHPDFPYLIHVGEVMSDQSMTFFEAFGRSVRRALEPWKVLVVGHEQLNRQRLGAVIANHALHEHVEFIDHLPQARLYELISGAAAGVLVPGPTSYWWTNHAKLVDYVGLRKPVLAVVPDPSEARSVLTKANLGIFLDGSVEQATSTLSAFLNGELPLPQPVAEECDRYLASSQVQSFVEVFESLM